MLVCEVSTKFGLFSLSAIFEQENHLPRANDRILIVSNHGTDPEAGDGLLEFARNTPSIREMYTDILSLNELLMPLHPTKWKAPKNQLEAASVGSVMAAAILGPNRPVTALLVESIQTPPSNTLATIFTDCDIYVYSDGLMTFSPTRFSIPDEVGSRIRALYYLDLIENITPALLREFSTPQIPIQPQFFHEALSYHSDASTVSPESGDLETVPVFLGQYLSGLGLCTPEEEVELYAQGLVACAIANGSREVFFKPHPTFSEGLLHTLKTSTALLGYTVHILRGSTLMEEYLLHHKPPFICSVFSTGLATANAIFDVPVYTFKARDFLNRLEPYQNSNRVPAALVLYAYPDILKREYWKKSEQPNLQQVTDLIAAAMQPSLQITDQYTQRKMLLASKDTEAFSILADARKHIENFKAPTMKSFEKYAQSNQSSEKAMQFRNEIEQNYGTENFVFHELSPLKQAQLLLKQGQSQEAFLVSMEAIKKTPDSTLHMKILEKVALVEGPLIAKKVDALREIHLAALKQRKRHPKKKQTKLSMGSKQMISLLIKKLK